MNSTSDPVFIDTNVLVYARDDRNAEKRERARAWLAAISDSGRARTNLQVLNELTRWVLKNEPGRPLLEVQDEIETIAPGARARSTRTTPNSRGSCARLTGISGSIAC